jgi:hypothetical protein
MKTVTWIVLVGIALAGCGSSSQFSAADDDVPLSEVPDGYAKAYCSALERCYGLLFELMYDREDCTTIVADSFRQGDLPSLEAAVEDGRVVYQGKLASACFEAVAERACGDLQNREIEECEAALRGTAAVGEPCELDEECEGSSICETSLACPGMCVRRYGAGVACLEDDQCADGLVCSSATAHCVAPAAEGEPCEGGIEAQCAGGLICVGQEAAEMMPGTCVPIGEVARGAAGEACDPRAAQLCAESASCVVTGITASAQTWSCRAVPESGGPCGFGLPENCPDGQYCPLTGLQILAGTVEARCAPLPAAGEACIERALPFLGECAAYTRCGDDGLCTPLRNLGESCDSNAVCYSGSCANGACEPARACD